MRKPPWLMKRLSPDADVADVRRLLRQQSLHTVCENARCPNLGECFSRKTATFLILGDVCTRHCGYCAIASGSPPPLDAGEPERVAETTANLGLRHVVVTSVTRDDLPDGGAAHFAETIRAIRHRCPGTIVEVLIPDFGGSAASLQLVLDAAPDILNHNVETVPRLFPTVRPQGDYPRSLELLKRAKDGLSKGYTKSGLMVGVGETEEEVRQVMSDLRGVGCDIFTAGQYLRPSKTHLEVQQYYTPEAFKQLQADGEEMGFLFVASGPFVRSSYHADQFKPPRSDR
ncbi:MAG TPA: lipoyl synthase [Chloroflexota bacterium]|nr:lipoyl synthase [Chloroflexota bacterium]